jgi:hypothetical protein
MFIFDVGTRKSLKRDEAFGDWMKKTMSGNGTRPMAEQLALFDGPAANYCTQSNRKGGLEELTTGVDGPSTIAALLRSGHSIGGSVKHYILQPHGGDEFCSRICAGMNLQGPDFALLPAHFTVDFLPHIDFSEFVWNYNLYDPCFQTTVPYLVAAVAYQWSTGWIRENFPGNHPLFTSPIIRNNHMVNLVEAGNIVTPTLLCADCGMRATGIPSSVRISMDLNQLAIKQEKMEQTFQAVIGGDGRLTGMASC